MTQLVLSEAQKFLLGALYESKVNGAFGIACDGERRQVAHKLEDLGLVNWRGTSWGSSFYSITQQGEDVWNSYGQG